MRLDLQHQAQDFEITVDGFARGETVHALVGLWSVLIDLGIQREDGDQREAMALRAGVVVEVVCAGDLDATRAKGAVDKVVGDDGNLAVAQGQIHHLAQQIDVALVLRVHGQRAVGHHGLGAGGGNRHAFLQHAIDQLRPVREGVQDVVHLALRLRGLHLQVTDRALQDRVPVHQSLAAVNQALLVELHKGLGHRFGQLGVHGEVFAAPVHAVAHAAHLGGDGVARLFFPFPDLGDEVLARLKRRGSHVVAADALGL